MQPVSSCLCACFFFSFSRRGEFEWPSLHVPTTGKKGNTISANDKKVRNPNCMRSTCPSRSVRSLKSCSKQQHLRSPNVTAVGPQRHINQKHINSKQYFDRRAARTPPHPPLSSPQHYLRRSLKGQYCVWHILPNTLATKPPRLCAQCQRYKNILPQCWPWQNLKRRKYRPKKIKNLIYLFFPSYAAARGPSAGGKPSS